MPANKNFIKDKSILLKKKLDKLSVTLQSSLKSSEFQTEEGFFLEAVRILETFYATLDTPITSISNVSADQLPDITIYNTLWNNLLDDLTIIFSEIENTESLTVENFNYVITESNRLTARLKSIASKLGDYMLYAQHPVKDVILFQESFNNLSRIDNVVPLNTNQCAINQAEGIVTLPVNKDTDAIIKITKIPIIDSISNGVLGNNQQLGSVFNGDTTTILDNNPDTWVEYENVVDKITDSDTALQLGMTLVLDKPTIINNITINPNNFGTRTVVHIDAIDTSIDGDLYTSIKDDIPINGFLTIDEDNTFTLAPATSKYAGQGIYTFTPRQVKYIHLLFRQDEPYAIDTPSGEKLRYAIGIRDIIVQGLQYEAHGELISTAFSVPNAISKVSLYSNQNPIELSELVSIRYFISTDKTNWYEIQPQQLDGVTGTVGLPEVLNFNNSDPNSINTVGTVKDISVKIQLDRKDDAFLDGASSFKEIIEDRIEVHSIPGTSPNEFSLEKAPVDNSISIIDPLYGSCGKPDTPYFISYDAKNSESNTYRLPIKNYPRPYKKVLRSNKWITIPAPSSEWLHIAVGGKEWVHATQELSNYSTTDEVYTFNNVDSVLKFGDGTNGKIPTSKQTITMWLDIEKLNPVRTDDGYVAKLNHATSNNKHDIAIKQYGIITQHTELISKHATIIRLTYDNLIDISGIESSTFFASKTKVEFINGSEELASGQYSIDKTNGVIYSSDTTPSDIDTAVSYTYQPIFKLSDNDWDWTTSDTLHDSISINDSVWKTIDATATNIVVDNNSNAFDLPTLHIVRDSVIFTVTNAGTAIATDENPFLKEILYIDGKSEFGMHAADTKESLTDHLGGLQTFTLKERILLDNTYPVVFSNDNLFVSEVSYEPSSDKEYRINRANNTIELYLDNLNINVGTITYYYNNVNESDYGLFSINYSLGKVYTQRKINSSWNITAQYQYSDYRIEYNIARLLDPNSYQVDIVNRIVRINDNEILRSSQLPRLGLVGMSPYYLVNYKYVKKSRENITGLRNYFTPVVKDYALKILPRGSLF